MRIKWVNKHVLLKRRPHPEQERKKYQLWKDLTVFGVLFLQLPGCLLQELMEPKAWSCRSASPAVLHRVVYAHFLKPREAEIPLKFYQRIPTFSKTYPVNLQKFLLVWTFFLLAKLDTQQGKSVTWRRKFLKNVLGCFYTAHLKHSPGQTGFYWTIGLCRLNFRESWEEGVLGKHTG